MVVRTNPGVVIPRNTGWSMLFKEPDAEFQVSAFTRYEPTNDAEVPRALHLVVDLAAASLDDAVSEALGNTGGLTTMMAFVGNSHVDSPELHVAYDVTGDDAEHEYVQTYRPPVDELPQLGAHLDLTLFEAVHDRLLASKHSTRLGMALVQYNEALRSLRPAGDVTAAGHLFMAVEALVDVVKKREMQATGFTSDEELAAHYGIDTTEMYKARNEITGHLRRTVIFHGDDKTHRALKKASDGFEHGFLPIVEVRKSAEGGHLPAAFHHVRRTICELLDLPADLVEHLAGIRACSELRSRDRSFPLQEGAGCGRPVA
ncbi:hypothetical protein [Streptomyces sp. NPDC048341]|uniref:hypothetical protein n=1 Tax=Streptomyces sp. NPDC048341 TaxID=3154620 RepID=UPI0034440C6B